MFIDKDFKPEVGCRLGEWNPRSESPNPNKPNYTFSNFIK